MRSKGQFPRRETHRLVVVCIDKGEREREREKERERTRGIRRRSRGRRRKREKREKEKKRRQRGTVSRKLSFCKTTRIMRVPAGGVVSFLRKKEGAISLLAGLY